MTTTQNAVSNPDCTLASKYNLNIYINNRRGIIRLLVMRVYVVYGFPEVQPRNSRRFTAKKYISIENNT